MSSIHIEGDHAFLKTTIAVIAKGYGVMPHSSPDSTALHRLLQQITERRDSAGLRGGAAARRNAYSEVIVLIEELLNGAGG